MQTPPPKVFVSSTWLDLEPERKAVETAIRRMSTTDFIGMEYFGSRDETTRRASLNEVDRSDIYVGIFAARYGSGITEDEYRLARERGLTCKIYFKATSSITLDKLEADPAQQARLAALKEDLRREHTCSEFSSPDDLAKQVVADLHGWIVNEYNPRFSSGEETTRDLVLAALHQLPAPPRDFTGRKEELDELSREIERGGATISGLQGQGGVGKTALALKLAEQLASRFPDAQFYLDLKGTTQPLLPSDAMAHVIRAYHPTAKLPDGEAELSALYNSVLHGQRALLLMDNARDAAQVSPLIPPAGCVLLVTSRQHFTLPGLYARDLDTLPPDDSRKLLLKIAPRIGDHAEEIARLCGHLPLALRLAASALAERRNLSAADYVRRLTDAQRRLTLIEASLSLSYDLLTPELQKLWRALAVFPDTFDGAAAAFVWEMEQEAAQDALGELVNHSLLDFDEGTARYSLHDLARLFADSRFINEEKFISQAWHALRYLVVLSEANDLYLQGGDAFMQGLSLFDAEWKNIQAGQSWAARHASDSDIMARLCGSYPDTGIYVLHLRLHPRAWVNWFEEALSAARKLNDRTAEAYRLGNLGTAYNDLGEPTRAIEFFKQVLVIARTDGDQKSESNALCNIGTAYLHMGKPRRAIEFHEQALAIDRTLGNRRGEGADLGNLGLAYGVLGETRRAIEFQEQCLTIEREIGDRRGEGNALWNMSIALDTLGESKRAIAHAEAALRIYEQIEDPNAAKVREALARWRGQTE